MEEVELEKDPIEEIDDQLRADIDALIHQGHLTDRVTFGGHSFDIRTLNAREGWATTAAAKPYEGTLAEPRVYMAAVVGLALIAYDGNPDFHIKLDDMDQHALKRLRFVGEWDDIIIERIFAAYNRLDLRRNRAREAIVDFPTGNPDNSLPWLDSLIEQGILSDETPQDNPF